MDRSDGRNPFDPQTYFIPNRTIQNMLELRAFCADFFEKHVRNRVDTDAADIAAFVTLINYSQDLFARARAVIPELQTPNGEPLLPNSSAYVQEVHSATRYMRGPPGLWWEHLPEEPAWAQLIPDGMNQEAKDVVDNEMGHKKQLSDASAHGSSSKHMFFVLLQQIC